MDPTIAPLYAGGPAQADTIFLQNLPASMDFSTQATFDESLAVSPTVWTKRYLQQQGWTGDDTDSPLVDVQSAQEYLKKGGFDPSTVTEPIHQKTLSRLTDRLYDKRAHEDAISRGPQGFLAGAARFGYGLAAQALDPINLASAFIPVFRAATIEALLGEAGGSALARAGVRAKIGAVEGAVGTAALEPGMHFLANQLHEDYTMADSFLNVAFGTVLGGGLHVGTGAITDWRTGVGKSLPPDSTPPIHEIPPQPGTPQRVAALSPEARVELGRVALAQAIDGREIDVAASLDLAEITQRAVDAERQPGFLKTAEELLVQRQEERQRATPGFLQTALDKLALRDLDAEKAAEQARIDERISGEVQNELGKLEDARQRELSQQLATQSPDENAARLADLMERQQGRAELLANAKALAEAAAERDLTPAELKGKLERMQAAGERDLRTYKEAALRQISQVSPELIQRLNDARLPVAERLHQTMLRGQSPESRLTPADRAMSEEAATLVETNKTPEGESVSAVEQKGLQEELANFERILKAKDSAADPAKAFTAEDEAIARAKDETKIMTAIAQCRLRKG